MTKLSIVLALAPTLFAQEMFAQEIIGPIRIHAGTSPFADVSGQVWASDTPYVQGITAVSSAPMVAVTNAANPALYQTQRISFVIGSACSAFSYVFSVPSTRYRVTLKVAELGTAPRSFRVSMNGGSAAVTITTRKWEWLPINLFYANVTNGSLTVALSASGTNGGVCPVLSAIEVVPQVPIMETDVTALTQDFSTVVRRGVGYGTDAVAFVDSNGLLETVPGEPGT